VQRQYEKTLEESERMLLERSSAAEELAQRLGRGLRIRRSAEQVRADKIRLNYDLKSVSLKMPTVLR